MDPIVSIIIPCYNQENYIAETLNCIIVQEFQDWECIVIDDGSTDTSGLICKKYSKDDRRIKYFKKINEGPSLARNYAISISKGKYILPLDADDLISKDYVQLCVEVLDKNPKVKLVYSEAEFFDQKKGKWILPEFTFSKLLLYNMIFCSAMYRKTDFLVTKGYDPKMAKGLEDWEFWIELLKTGGKVIKLRETHFYYRIKNSSRTTNIDLQTEADLKKQIYLNHYELYYEKYGDPLSLIGQMEHFKKHYNLLKNSNSYKIGTHIAKLLFFLKKPITKE
ncbi:MAG: glycosyltransferase family 2 protein [Ignavibacteriales bacterium]|nr:glycosyltransferase family 2 protein [Ignavibacteriales bacterium]